VVYEYDKPEGREETAKSFRLLVDCAVKLDVAVVCTLAGMPVAGKEQVQDNRGGRRGGIPPLVEYAASKGIKVALEKFLRHEHPGSGALRQDVRGCPARELRL